MAKKDPKVTKKGNTRTLRNGAKYKVPPLPSTLENTPETQQWVEYRHKAVMDKIVSDESQKLPTSSNPVAASASKPLNPKKVAMAKPVGKITAIGPNHARPPRRDPRVAGGLSNPTSRAVTPYRPRGGSSSLAVSEQSYIPPTSTPRQVTSGSISTPRQVTSGSISVTPKQIGEGWSSYTVPNSTESPSPTSSTPSNRRTGAERRVGDDLRRAGDELRAEARNFTTDRRGAARRVASAGISNADLLGTIERGAEKVGLGTAERAAGFAGRVAGKVGRVGATGARVGGKIGLGIMAAEIGSTLIGSFSKKMEKLQDWGVEQKIKNAPTVEEHRAKLRSGQVGSPPPSPVPIAKAAPVAKPSTPSVKVKRGLSAFGSAFSLARKSGAQKFEYKGKKYNTKLANEAVSVKPPAQSKEEAPGPMYDSQKYINNLSMYTPGEEADVIKKEDKFGSFLKSSNPKGLPRRNR